MKKNEKVYRDFMHLFVFSFFCNTKPFSAKVMSLICFSAMINVYAKNFMYYGKCELHTFLYQTKDREKWKNIKN